MLAQHADLLDDANALGERLLESGRIDDALAAFEIAVRNDANNGIYVNNLAAARFLKGDVGGALAALEQALASSSDRRLYTLNFADIARTQPRLLQRGFEVCQAYLNEVGQDEEIAGIFDRIADELEDVSSEYRDALADMPEHARVKVNGKIDPDHLITMGEAIADCILFHMPDIAGARTILDFGVGLGRVLWPLSRKLPRARFVGFDVDPMMLSNLTDLRIFKDTQLVHTTAALDDNCIDAAYVISVFTHLDHTADYWLWELNRVLAPGGLAFVTYHDETLFEENRKRLNLTMKLHKRRVVGRGSEGSTNIGTFYTTAEWERSVERFFEIVETVPRGLAGHQSFSVLRKVETPIGGLGLHRTYMRDLEDELYKLRLETDHKV